MYLIDKDCIIFDIKDNTKEEVIQTLVCKLEKVGNIDNASQFYQDVLKREKIDVYKRQQLYQIKGRVGRSERVAYAYLLYAKNKQMNEEASKRLKAIKEFAQLGSGYKIAMRDLSIRGSGDILGGEQAGFIDTVGFDMYMKILQDAIDEKTGEKKEERCV